MADHEEENPITVEEEEEEEQQTITPSFPISRVKKIIKLDKDINKINSEALYLITCSTELFLQFLAEKSAKVAIEKKKKTIKLDHLLVSVKQHQPTSDFLLDCLPKPSQPSDLPRKDQSRPRAGEKSPPAGTRRIDAFFQKCT